jgi:hypothetical protein
VDSRAEQGAGRSANLCAVLKLLPSLRSNVKTRFVHFCAFMPTPVAVAAERPYCALE